MLDFLRKVIDDVTNWWNEEAETPLKVSIMGQTGVGKSSLINALFGTNLHTDPVRPGTITIEERRVKGASGHDVIFYDLPGIGESPIKDEEYVKQYKQKLLESDVAIWTIHADSRSFAFDSEALKKVLDTMNKEQSTELMSKIIFVLTKVDLLTPTKPAQWILYKLRDEGVFTPMELIETLINQKEEYFSKAFIHPFKSFIRGQTFCSGKFNVNDSRLQCEKHIVIFDGLLELEDRDRLQRLYPQFADVFRRLYDQYHVIPCSSHFRYNLDLLTRVITDKLASRSAGRFQGFLVSGTMDRVPFVEAKKYCNIVLVEDGQGGDLIPGK